MAGELTAKSRRILEALAEGHSLEQILEADLSLTYPDIQKAAREALELRSEQPEAEVVEIPGNSSGDPWHRTGLEWEEEERENLLAWLRQGFPFDRITKKLHRHPSEVEHYVQDEIGPVEQAVCVGDAAELTDQQRSQLMGVLRELCHVCGGMSEEESREFAAKTDTEEAIEMLIDFHDFHMREREFDVADLICSKTEEVGIIILEDNQKGERWRLIR